MHQLVGPSRNIVIDLDYVDPDNSFEANKKMCRQMRGGIAAIFGPVSDISRAHVQALSQAFEIPHIESVWDARTPREYFSINVYPDHEVLSQAYAAVLVHWEWKEFTVIYEDNNSLIRLQKILETARGEDYKMTIRQLDEHMAGYISMLKDMHDKLEYRVVIDCHVDKARDILDAGANITAMRLIKPTKPDVLNIMAEWGIMENNIGRSPLLGKSIVATDTALMYDAVQLFARALASLSNQQLQTQELFCGKRETWKKGSNLLNYIKAIDYHGLSGKIRFEDGRRKDFDLDVIGLTNKGLVEIGTWNRRTGVNITVTPQQKQKDELERLKNMTLRVVTIFDPPYCVEREEPDENGRMQEGFIVDLMDHLAATLGFKYEIYGQDKRAYGSLQSDGKWDGMIGDLIERDSKNKADLAAAGLTITYERAKVVDFTMPFLNLGITIIYKKPVKTPPDLFSFLLPLSIDVWIYMIAAYLCVSFMLFVIARFTPYEWENPHPCDQESEEVENQFTILNSLWFTIGSLMQQGCDIMPKAMSTRMVAILWWFFVLIFISSYTANLTAFLTVSRMEVSIKNADDLSKQSNIMYGTLKSGSTRGFFQASSSRFVASVWYVFTLVLVSSYTANLAAHLTIRRMESPIKNADDLSMQTEIQYGTLQAGSTRDFFKNSNLSTYKRMNSYFEANADKVLVNNNGEGFKRVMEENYAYIAESTTIDYKIQRNCELMQIGSNLDSKGYGIAAPKVAKIYKKWWVDQAGTVCVNEEDPTTNNNALGVRNVGGVFVVLAGGSLFGLLVSLLEFLWKAAKNARKDKQSFCSELAEELRFILRCKSSRNFGEESSKEMVDPHNGVKYSPANTVPNDKKHRDLLE
ncbi:GRIK1-like protein [Mya arenaria]|uniref:GRIK1-like protein n=1 Tax=Mya arenaria TaxID=6604 RepID=A0ABY7EF28_MYAAR|nr:GRIK1-like protein [Mya arenaria]